MNISLLIFLVLFVPIILFALAIMIGEDVGNIITKLWQKCIDKINKKIDAL